MKLISWVLIGLLAWFAYKFVVVSQRKAERAARARDDAGAGASGAGSAGGTDGAARPAADGAPSGGERMVACAHCNVYLPQSESLVSGDRRYCCTQHRDAGPRA